MGPLQEIRIIELSGIGPGPFCGMMLADMGAEVIRIERPGNGRVAPLDPLSRNRKSLACNLKDPAAVEAVLRLIEGADGLFEGYRPGVTERLGLGPDVCLEHNPRLVYGRMTGWGQEGPLAHAAGHDMNYIALTGALHAIGPLGKKPVPPLNLVGDFGGGGMLLAYGMVCALLHAKRTGEGQVIDAAMVDGANSLMAASRRLRALGLNDDKTGSGYLGGEAHFYDTYETSDGKYVSIASIEPKFYDLLIEKAGLDRERFEPFAFKFEFDDRTRAGWADLKRELATVIKKKTRAEWCEIMEGSDVCFAPVLTLSEALEHPHNTSRNAFVNVGGNPQPAPAPRFSRTQAANPRAGVAPGTHTREILADAGFSTRKIDALLDSGAVTKQ